MILLLNVSGVIDMKLIKELHKVDAIVYISQGGSAFGDAVTDVLTGKVTPSGKLTTTWALNYEDYPNSKDFAGVHGNEDDFYYKEGIFVVYRYFATFGIKPLYPFGYGSTYTDFSITTKQVMIEEEYIKLEVRG